MSIGHRLGLRLFLEGVEVPVIGADIQVVPNQPASASIQIIATDRVLELLPRTVVHLFFFDFVDASSPLPSKEIENPTSTKFADVINSQYKLLFMGEVQGISFTKGVDQRSVVLSCIDFSNYWDTTYQYNFQGAVIGGRREAAFIGANTNLLTSPLGHGTGTFSRLLNSRPVSFPNMKGLLGGIIRTLEAVGGAYYGRETFKGANDFSAIAELRLKLLQQITAAEKDSSTARLFARKSFNNWINRQVGSLGKMVTFRGVIKTMQDFIYHEVFPCPVAKFQPKIGGLVQHTKTNVNIANDKTPLTARFVSNVEAISDSASHLTTYLLGIPKGTETLFDAQSSFQHMAKLMPEITGPAIPKIEGLESDVSKIHGNFKHVRAWLCGSTPGVVNRASVGNPDVNGRAREHLDTIITIVESIMRRGFTRKGSYTYDQLERVNNQMFRPDVWWAAAPRCNVLFPEMYTALNWERNFLREVTRLELQTTNEVLGDDALFNGRYYAPNIEDMRSGLKLSSRKFGRLIMQHELLTGILPVYEKMTDANIFAMKSKEAKGKSAKVGYAQRAANFQYFKHRFASRQMSAAGRFNPWFVPGFPAVIIDRPMEVDKLIVSNLPIEEQVAALNITPVTGVDVKRSDLLRKLVGPQYVGSCVQMSHSMNQAGGTTSYAFMQARVHREDTEYLGVDKLKVSTKSKTSASRTTAVSGYEANPPKVGGKGPRGGKITKVKVATDSYRGRELPRFGADGKLVAGFLESATADEVQAYEVTETYFPRSKVEVDVPIEEVLRPPWVWDGWSNLKIGETYMQFFGTNAITDVDGLTSRELLDDGVLIGFGDVEVIAEKAEGLSGNSGQINSEAKPEFRSPGKKRKRKRPVKNVPNPQVVGRTPAQATGDQQISAVTVEIVESERSIENSIDRLTRVYSQLSHKGLDIGAFIRNYTWRPVATMIEILGTSDLTIVEDTNNNSIVINGTEGFHSRAFADQEDLFGLVNPQVKRVLGLGKNADPAAARRLDVRKLRRDAVRDYVDELTNSRGLLG